MRRSRPGGRSRSCKERRRRGWPVHRHRPGRRRRGFNGRRRRGLPVHRPRWRSGAVRSANGCVQSSGGRRMRGALRATPPPAARPSTLPRKKRISRLLCSRALRVRALRSPRMVKWGPAGNSRRLPSKLRWLPGWWRSSSISSTWMDRGRWSERKAPRSLRCWPACRRSWTAVGTTSCFRFRRPSWSSA